jgi:hypothetical protein
LRPALVFLLAISPPLLAAAPAEVQFYRDIRPILANHCFRCHGPDAEARQAELRLDLREGLFGAGASGRLIVQPGDPAESELYRRITAEQADKRMPPAEARLPLSDARLATLRRWIEAGSRWQEHWSYTPIVRPEVPELADVDSASNAIDRFLLVPLRQAGLSLAEPADAMALVRRLSLDLTGLPPTGAEVTAFAADPSETAYAALVERFLASPHYGERMAVYWLDLVRYADSCGYHSDVEQPIAPYRNYVIQAFRDNLPFDQFTREQLAGDLLPSPTREQRIATGYNRLSKTTEEGGAQAGEYLAKGAADRVRTTAGVWLAATLGCAECHDHKYDPFTTRDFYSFAAFFADVQEQGVWRPGGRPPEVAVPTPEQTARQGALQAELAELKQRLSNLGDSRGDERAALEKQAGDLTAARDELEKSIPRTMVTVSVAPREMRVLPRGNWLDSSGPIVQSALPAFLAAPAAEQPRLSRLDLAEWLVARDNPLTARVFVNRLWKLFFGAGLSRRLDDLGAQGEPPTHPELLDWLAAEFIESGWDVKHVIRLLVTSRAYRQTSVPNGEQVKRDPLNRLFARQSRWRLEAEFVRDAGLAISGQLSRQIGGPSVKPYQPEGYWEFLNFPKRTWKADLGANQNRRGLYTHWQRTFLHPSLSSFDAPSREECAAERPVSNTPQAALVLLNDPTYVECARMFACRVLAQNEPGDENRVAWAWREALSRSPQPREAELLLELLAESRAVFVADESAARNLLEVGQTPLPPGQDLRELAAWTAVARAILNLNETVSRN